MRKHGGLALLAGNHRNGILMWKMFLSHDLIIIGASGSGLLQQTFIFIIRRQLTYIGKIIRGYANDTQTTPCQLLWLLLTVYFNRQFGSKALPGPLMIYIWWCIHEYTHTYTFPLFHTFFELSSSFWSHSHANMPYFARTGWGRLDCNLVLLHTDMFSRIYFTHIVFTCVSSGTGLLTGPLSDPNRFSNNVNCTYIILLSYTPFNYYLARVGSCDDTFRLWQFIEQYLGELGITTVVPILRKDIHYSHLLAYPKAYAHGFICCAVFILWIRIATM